MQDRPMGGSEAILAMAYICVVHPNILMDRGAVIFEVANSEMRIVFRIIDDKEVAVILECPQGFCSPFDAPVDILIELLLVCPIVVAYTHIVVWIGEGTVYGHVG